MSSREHDCRDMPFRQATPANPARLAQLNRQFIRYADHRNRMTVPELEQRMRGGLAPV